MEATLLDTVRLRNQSARDGMATPHLILVGYGITDSLQLTVEAQRVISRWGVVHALEVPPNLAAFLKSQRIRVRLLTGGFAPGQLLADSYLDIASKLLEETARERPVVFLSPGHPMVFNSVGRYLAAESRRLGLSLAVVPAPSQLGLIIGGIGLDVSTFGLQVFDATRLVSRQVKINPLVPALIMHAGSFQQTSLGGNGAALDIRPLVRHLEAFYPQDHPVAVVNLTREGMSLAQVAFRHLHDVAAQLNTGSHLFLDLVQTPTQGTPA